MKFNNDITCEQHAREMMCRITDDDSWQNATGGDVVELANLIAEVERLRALVDKLPKTADGVPVVPGVDYV